ncbi:MAG: acyltransferase [Anaerolineaceae bacterium]|nr:acyltransferase [Anaerolineaceae bacterium]
MARSAAKFSVHLDAMRALAATTVFAGHARVLFIGSILGAVGVGANAHTSLAVGRRANEQTNPGHLAVIVFFVLSGYLVGGGTLRAWQRNVWTWREYAIQRMSRLWVVLIPALVLTVSIDRLGISLFGFSGIYGGPTGQDSIAPNILSRLDAKTFFGCLFFVQDILTKTLGSDSPLWTLSYEFWFYIAFPLFLGAATRRYSLRWRLGSAALLIATGMFAGPKIAAYYLIWLLGASLQLIPKRLSLRTAQRLTVPVLISFLAISLLLITLQLRLFVSDAIAAIACWALCYVLLHDTTAAGDGIYTRLSKRLSDMSYTVYLGHMPLLTFICAALMTQWVPWKLNVIHLVYFALILTATFLVLYLLYWCFEHRTESVRKALHSVFAGQTVQT